MEGLISWKPLRWLSGPLDISRREKAATLTPEAKTALEQWHNPTSLEFLKNSPVDCLIVSWAAGLPQDAEQQRTLKPLIEQARKAGLKVVALIEGEGDKKAAAAAAKTAGADAVAMEGEAPAGIPAVWWGERGKAPQKSSALAIAANDGVWPGVQAPQGGADGEAGPTGAPWVDSNCWGIRLIQALAPSKPIWFAADPDPKKAATLRPASYALAVADSEAYGGRWIISLGDKLRSGLAARDAKAMETWQAVSKTLQFFNARLDWKKYDAVGALAVISDFEGPNEYLGHELLNLTARRILPFRVILKSKAEAASFAGLKAIFFPDEQEPSPALRKKLLGFVNAGGLLMTGPKWKPEGTELPPDFYNRYHMRKLGKGRLAVPKEESPDPYLMAGDMHLLLSYRNDILRLWNAGTMGTYYTVSPDRKKGLVQIVSYSARRASHDVSVGLTDRYRTGRFWSLESPDTPKPVKVVAQNGLYELHLPEFGAYAAVELEK